MVEVKRTIDELRVRLIREKKIREIYVEGIFDRDLYRWALREFGLDDVKVYPISTVDVPSDLLVHFGLSTGEKQRVMATALSLEKYHGIHDQILFIVDADTDYALNRPAPNLPLMRTAGTCAELMFWKVDVIRKFIALGLGCDQADRVADEVMRFVEPIAASVFLLRAAKEELNVDWKLIDVADSFDRKAPFCFDAYCTKVADKNGARARMEEIRLGLFQDIIKRLESLSKSQKLHGHDVVSSLSRKLRIDGYSQKCLVDHLELSRLLMACADWAQIKEDPTLSSIRDRFATKSNACGA